MASTVMSASDETTELEPSLGMPAGLEGTAGREFDEALVLGVRRGADIGIGIDAGTAVDNAGLAKLAGAALNL